MDHIQEEVKEDDEEFGGDDGPKEPINPDKESYVRKDAKDKEMNHTDDQEPNVSAEGHGADQKSLADQKQADLEKFKAKLEKIEGFLQSLREQKDGKGSENESQDNREGAAQEDSDNSRDSQLSDKVEEEKDESPAKNEIVNQKEDLRKPNDVVEESKSRKRGRKDAFKIKLQRLQDALNAMRASEEISDDQEDSAQSLQRDTAGLK